MSDSRMFETPESGRAEVEAMLFAARNYVQTSDDLRPRVLEAAHEHCDDRRAEQKLGSFAVAVMVMLILASPLINYVATLQGSALAHSAAQVQQRAAEMAIQQGVGSHWALAEAFSQWRVVQASRLTQSSHRGK